MKAITLTQPFASLIAIGAKRIETRSWRTNYRGPLAIHAAKGYGGLPGRNLTDFCLNEPFRSALFAGGIRQLVPGQDLPLGAVVAVATLHACVLANHCTEFPWWEGSAAPHELAFGDFTPGRWLWILRDVLPLPEPIPARGSLNLWEWNAPAEVLALLKGR